MTDPSVLDRPADQTADLDLYAAFRDRGDERALARLVERHWSPSWRLALALARDPAAAEDVAQQAFVRLVLAARARLSIAVFPAWLRATVLNEARSHARAEKRRVRREEAVAVSPETPAASPDSLGPLREQVEHLPETLREPLVLHYGMGLTHAEVGEALGCPAGTASSRIREGLERLRERFQATGQPAALASLEAGLAAWQASLEAKAPPAPPRLDVLLATPSAPALGVGGGVGKKLAALFAAALLVVVGTTARSLVTGPPSPSSVGPGALGLAPAPLDTAATGSSGTSSDATPVPALGTHDVPGGESEGPPRAVAVGADPAKVASVASTATNDAASGAASKKAGASPEGKHRLVGKVVDADGRPVAGAKVAFLGHDPSTAGPGLGKNLQVTRRAKAGAGPGAVGPGGAPKLALAGGPQGLPPPLDFEKDIQRAVATSLALRHLAELAATTTADDGTFSFFVPTSTNAAPGGPMGGPGTTVGMKLGGASMAMASFADTLVSARVEKAGTTLAAEKPLEGVLDAAGQEDAGTVVVTAIPSLTVAVRSGGNPVEGAQVRFVDAGTDEASAATDRTGVARRATASPSVLVTVSKAGFATERRQAVLREGDVRLDVELTPSATLSGVVLGPDGRPLAGVPITADEPDAPTVLLARDQKAACATATDDQGHFTLDGLAPGRAYDVTAKPADPGVLGAELTVTAPAPDVTINLGAAGSLVVEITATGDAGREARDGWPGLDPQMLQADGTWHHADGDRSASGNRVTFARLVPGTYRVKVQPIAFAPVTTQPVTVAGGATATVPLELRRGRDVTGRVVDSSGKPLAHAHVGRGDQGFFVMLMAGDDARFKLSGFSDEASKIVVQAPGCVGREVVVQPGVTDLGDVVLEAAPATEAPPEGGTATPGGK